MPSMYAYVDETMFIDETRRGRFRDRPRKPPKSEIRDTEIDEARGSAEVSTLIDELMFIDEKPEGAHLAASSRSSRGLGTSRRTAMPHAGCGRRSAVRALAVGRALIYMYKYDDPRQLSIY